jgi:hypothetical protein
MSAFSQHASRCGRIDRLVTGQRVPVLTDRFEPPAGFHAELSHLLLVHSQPVLGEVPHQRVELVAVRLTR